MALPLARLHSFSQYNTGSRKITRLQLISIKGLKQDPEAAQTLLWWCTFKPQPKSISRSLIEAAVTTDVPKEDYWGHLSNLSFKGRWPAEQCGLPVKGLRHQWGGRLSPSRLDNTTAVVYLLKEGGTHCKTLNGVVRKILLKCYENGITVCPEYLRGVENLWADALSRGKKAQEWSLGYQACHRLFKCWGTPSSGPLCKQSGSQGTPIFQPEPLRQREHLRGDSLKDEVGQRASGIPYLHPNIIQIDPGEVK